MCLCLSMCVLCESVCVYVSTLSACMCVLCECVPIYMCAYVCVWAYVHLHACIRVCPVRACVCACVRTCLQAYACGCVRPIIQIKSGGRWTLRRREQMSWGSIHRRLLPLLTYRQNKRADNKVIFFRVLFSLAHPALCNLLVTINHTA